MYRNAQTGHMITVVMMAVVAVLAGASSALANTLNVPRDYATIQEAIDAAVNADIVQVAAGTYNENLVWQSKSIALIGAGADATSVNGSGSGCCLVMRNVPDTARVEGFTFTGGTGMKDADFPAVTYGGGFYLDNSSPTLKGNVISGNSCTNFGGGLFLRESSPTLVDNTITGNSSGNNGGGLYLRESSPTLTSNIVADNSSSNHGGGLYLCYCPSPTLRDNTITGNSGSCGGGLFVYHSSPTLSGNSITHNSRPHTVYGSGSGLHIVVSSPVLTGNVVASNMGYGIHCFASSPTIEGNRITRNTRDGILLSDWFNKKDEAGLSEPDIRENTISGNGCWGINCQDTAAANASTLEDDNIFEANSRGQVLQWWWGFAKVVNDDGSPAKGASVTVLHNGGQRTPDYGLLFTTSRDMWSVFKIGDRDAPYPSWFAVGEFEVGNDGVRKTLTPQRVRVSLQDAFGTATHSWNGRNQIVEVRLSGSCPTPTHAKTSKPGLLTRFAQLLRGRREMPEQASLVRFLESAHLTTGENSGDTAPVLVRANETMREPVR